MTPLDEYYEKVQDIYSREEFDSLIDEKKEEYNHLFDEEALAMMIVAEEGRNESAVKEIGEIEPGDGATITGEVIDTGTLRTFKKGNGEGRVRNVRLDDGTGTVKLVLWDEDTDLVGDTIELGGQLRVINGYVQDKGYGLQIQAGKWGEVKVEGQGGRN